jgi:RNA polymerase sigma-70 factor (ECF subfamily)
MKGKSAEIDMEAYYVRYGPMVLRRCRRMLRDEQDAFDACQEVFVRLLVYRHKLEDRYPSSLLYRIATNHCLNLIRDRRKEGKPVPLPAAEGIPGRSLQDPETALRSLLEPVLREEKEETRTMAYLYFIDGWSLQQIADNLEISVTGVHKRLKKLRRAEPERGAAP